jgi:hypothetical protein
MADDAWPGINRPDLGRFCITRDGRQFVELAGGGPRHRSMCAVRCHLHLLLRSALSFATS